MISYLKFNVWHLDLGLKATFSYILNEIKSLFLWTFSFSYFVIICEIEVFELQPEMCNPRFSMKFFTFEENNGTFKNLYKLFYRTIRIKKNVSET